MMNEFEKKIIPYLDGSLSASEKSEFEAYVSTHPEFKTEIESKRDELERLRSMIPVVQLSTETKASIESEIQQSIFNLLKDEPRNLMDRIKLGVEDWLNR